jgi:hypothetical protein
LLMDLKFFEKEIRRTTDVDELHPVDSSLVLRVQGRIVG